MTEVEQPPQNGIDPTAGDDDENSKARPADIEQDMREMERRKRVEAIMGSKLFREELERIVDSAREGGAGASGILQQLSDIVGVPVTRVGNVFKSSSCMVPINDIRGVESMGYAKGEKILRCKLAATFRLLDLYGWTQGLGAQITARLKVDQEYFLVNPYGLLYHEITASALNKVDMQGNIVEQGTTNFGVNKSHFVLHSVVHAARPDIRCAIYIGCSPVVAISSLKTGLLALTKDACVLGEISTHAYTGLFDEEERNRLVRSLGPNSKVMLLANHGALCCGETIEEAFYAACHIVQACETQLKLLPVGVDNLVLIPEESRKLIYDQSRRPPEDLEKKFAAAVTTEEDGAAAAKEEAAAPPKIGSPPKWRVGGAEFEALMRMLDNAGYRTGYIYRHPLIKSDPPKPKNDVELPPAVSSLGYLLEEEELFRQGIWKKGDLRKGGDRSRWLNSPNVYQKVEVLETGTPDPKKITKWVAEGSPTHSTPVRIEDPLQFVPAGTTTKEFKRVQQQIKDNRRADKISAGPQSHILEGVTWDEANRIKDATVSQAGDHVVLMGAASKGIIQRGFQHNATVYKAPYAKNPFDNVTDDELNEYKRTVERKKKSIHGEYTDTDFSESEALNSMQAAGAHAHAKHAQSEPETGRDRKKPYLILFNSSLILSSSSLYPRAEHQVIQIQTQQAPIPSQAEVVLSDGKFQALSRLHFPVYYVYAHYVYSTHTYTPTHMSTKLRLPPPHENMQGEFYTYAYGATASLGLGMGISLGRCCQPQICSVLLHAMHSEHLHNMAYYRGNGHRSSGSASSTGTTNTNTNTDSFLSRRPLQLANGLPSPYRTVSHFGFQSPRQPPRLDHKHLPAGVEYIRAYRAMHRGISYEEIFATPRYEQLCPPCFEQLLRLKPELQRQSGASSSGGDDPGEDVFSYASSSATPQRLATLAELHNEHEYEELPASRCDAGTQTCYSSLGCFLEQIDQLNFSQESPNANYLVQSPSSPGVSVAPSPSCRGADMRANVTEVWNFGNWQEQQQQSDQEEQQQPLTERRITLEITQKFNAEQQAQEQERQLMTREERQRRKLEFQELWQDHVEYYGAKQAMEQELTAAPAADTTADRTLTLTLEAQEAETLKSYSWLQQLQPATMEAIAIEAADPNETLQPSEVEIPQIIQDLEQSLSTAGENLDKLMAATKKLCSEEFKEEAIDDLPVASESVDSGMLFRAIDLENIPDADETASILEPLIIPTFSSDEAEEEPEEEGEYHVTPEEEAHDEKRDDEKPVTPLPSVELESKEKLHVECSHMDEKDVDEHEYGTDGAEHQLATIVIDPELELEISSQEEDIPSSSNEHGIFSPLESEILERIQSDRLIERESIFGRIDRSIRNKLTPCRMQRMVSDVETFRTYTHIFKTPPSRAAVAAAAATHRETPHLFQFNSEPRPSAYSMHSANTPSSSSARLRLIKKDASRRSRSWSSERSERSGHSGSSSMTSPPATASPESLERAISSTTFVYRSSPRKKRNFIQENIRNASKPRLFASASARKPMQSSASTASAVCTFQAEQRSCGARLWVSLPTSPRDVIGQKRRSGSPTRMPDTTTTTTTTTTSTEQSTSSASCAKRRRQGQRQGNSPPQSLQHTMSSRTFRTGTLLHAVSSTTFAVDTTGSEGEERKNVTNSSMYYSANDSAR
ncbi:hypothetical protein KR222_004352, partial [Zaprionus bogoriensis]